MEALGLSCPPVNSAPPMRGRAPKSAPVAPSAFPRALHFPRCTHETARLPLLLLGQFVHHFSSRNQSRRGAKISDGAPTSAPVSSGRVRETTRKCCRPIIRIGSTHYVRTLTTRRLDDASRCGRHLDPCRGDGVPRRDLSCAPKLYRTRLSQTHLFPSGR
jgi:hypothetical protein